MNIDFIKKCAERAEGFELDVYMGKDVIICPDGMKHYLDILHELKNCTWDKVDYQLLLQKTIEKLNDSCEYDIWIGINSPNLYRFVVRFLMTGKQNISGWIFKTRDEAKTAALKYVFEMENKSHKY